MKRRTLLAAALSASAIARAQPAWPTRPIRWIVPFAPGGGTDTVSRLIADQLSRSLGQTVVVDNKGGAGGNIGTVELARAAPDGYTLGLISVTSHTLNPMLCRKLAYDLDKDIVGISRLAILSNLLGVTPSLPAHDVAELIQLCKAAPGKYAFASSGPGSSLHLSGELFKIMAGVDIVHVPYKGAGAVYGDLIAGVVQMMFANISSMLPQVRGSKVRGLAITSAERSKATPDLPAIAETLPGYVATSWYDAGAPAGTPEPILAKLEAAITAALATPEIQKRWTDDLGLGHAAARAQGLRPVPGGGPQALGASGEGIRGQTRLASFRPSATPRMTGEERDG
jgi:tripartite-type tricarboxylate transporter receptor subunit TctC